MLEKESVYNLRNRDVKRMLWPVDHEQTKQDLRKEQLKIKKELTARYNFDFDTEKALHGKYTWVSVDSESPIASPCLIDANVPCCSTDIAKRSSSSVKKRPSQQNLTDIKKKQKTSNTISSPVTTYSLRRDRKKSGKNETFCLCSFSLQ